MVGYRYRVASIYVISRRLPFPLQVVSSTTKCSSSSARCRRNCRENIRSTTPRSADMFDWFVYDDAFCEKLMMFLQYFSQPLVTYGKIVFLTEQPRIVFNDFVQFRTLLKACFHGRINKISSSPDRNFNRSLTIFPALIIDNSEASCSNSASSSCLRFGSPKTSFMMICSSPGSFGSLCAACADRKPFFAGAL